MTKFLLTLFILTLTSSAHSNDIFTAIDEKNYVLLESIIKADINSTKKYNENGQPAIWMTVVRKDTTALRILLDNGANVNEVNNNGSQAIVVACLVDSYYCAKILLASGADVNFTSVFLKGQKPIRLAAPRGSIELLKLLIEYGADIESAGEDKATPVMGAIYGNNIEVARHLFKLGAKLDYIARDGECIIHTAIRTKNPEMVKLTLRYNPPLHYKDPKGRTTWQLAKLTNNSSIKKMIKNALANQ